METVERNSAESVVIVSIVATKHSAILERQKQLDEKEKGVWQVGILATMETGQSIIETWLCITDQRMT